jgi:hypothetical protein
MLPMAAHAAVREGGRPAAARRAASRDAATYAPAAPSVTATTATPRWMNPQQQQAAMVRRSWPRAASGLATMPPDSTWRTTSALRITSNLSWCAARNCTQFHCDSARRKMQRPATAVPKLNCR